MLPHTCFNKPRSDLCITCENFKKELNQIASDMQENRDDEKIKIHQQAIEHLETAKRERDYYYQCIHHAEKSYLQLGPLLKKTPCKPNYRKISMEYLKNNFPNFFLNN